MMSDDPQLLVDTIRVAQRLTQQYPDSHKHVMVQGPSGQNFCLYCFYFRAWVRGVVESKDELDKLAEVYGATEEQDDGTL